MSAVKTQAETCSVCGRGILKGERTYDYATPAGDVRDVCALCRPSAERAGWLPPSRMRGAGQVRDERRQGLVSALLARRPVRAGDTASAPKPPAAETPTTPRQAPVQAPKPPADPVTAALATFNSRDYPRMIAGLTKTLGPPSAEVRQRGDAVEITVAWELSWYQWRVERGEVSEIAKGAEIAEREDFEPQWNAEVGANGSLSIRSGS